MKRPFIRLTSSRSFMSNQTIPSKPTASRSAGADTGAIRSEHTARPTRLPYRVIIECGIVWVSALIVAVGGLMLTESTLEASGKIGSAVTVNSTLSENNSSDNTGSIGTDTQNADSPSYNNKVGDRQLPIYCVKTDQKKVALSFDAAWGNEDTRILMDILAKYNVKVTFFMTGGWVNKFPEDVKYIAEQGHDLGNHSLSHKEMSKLSESEICKELQTVHDKVKELTGVEMDLFRPPYGDYDDEVITTAQSMGYFTIQWDVDSLDWKDYGADSIVKTVCNHKNLKNGSIILMHNGAKYTPEALESVIKGLLELGYEIVPISELIIRDSYHLDHTGMQIAN